MNILIIGLGSIARKHIDALEKIEPEISIYALRSSRTEETYKKVVNIFSLKEIQHLKIDFAIVSNPTSEHKKTILDILPLKCPLFIEKPLFFNLDIAGLLDEIQKASNLTYVACNLRFLDCLKFVEKNIREKKTKQINEVNVYCGSYLPEWRNTDFRKTYSAIPELGGGVHIDLIHELDYLYWIFGSPQQTHAVLKNSSSLQISAIDYANYCLDYKSFCANVILNYYRRDYKRTFELVFEDTSWLTDLKQNTVSSGEQILFSSTQQIGDTYYEQMKYFMELINSGAKQSVNTVFDAYNVLKISLQ